MDIYFELVEIGTKQVVDFHQNLGDCLFDAIAYLPRYLKTFDKIVLFARLFECWHI